MKILSLEVSVVSLDLPSGTIDRDSCLQKKLSPPCDFSRKYHQIDGKNYTTPQGFFFVSHGIYHIKIKAIRIESMITFYKLGTQTYLNPCLVMEYFRVVLENILIYVKINTKLTNLNILSRII